MSRYSIEIELFKGEEPIDFPIDIGDDDEDFANSVMLTQLALDRGDADKAIIYIAKKGELIDIITETKDTFNAKTLRAKVDSIKGEQIE